MYLLYFIVDSMNSELTSKDVQNILHLRVDFKSGFSISKIVDEVQLNRLIKSHIQNADEKTTEWLRSIKDHKLKDIGLEVPLVSWNTLNVTESC